MFCNPQKRILILLFICATKILFAQQDSISNRTAGDTAFQQNDTSKILKSSSSVIKTDSSFYKTNLLAQQILKAHPYFNFHAKAAPQAYSRKIKAVGKEIYFYVLCLILLIFAISKTVFAKYFNDLISLFFRRTLKQRQLQQQLLKDSLPSLIFNIIFIIVAGIYIALLIQELGTNLKYPTWQLVLYCVLAIAIVYLVKYLVLRLSGWMFNFKRIIDAYIFLVFLVNKIIGLFLLPVIVVIALGNVELKTVIWTLSWVLLAGLFIYRSVIALGLIRNEAASGLFHFVLYILAFEILPLLMIYKAISFF